MIVLGIETTCDETAVSLVRDGLDILSAVTATQLQHAEFGGVVPEVARAPGGDVQADQYLAAGLDVRTGHMVFSLERLEDGWSVVLDDASRIVIIESEEQVVGILVDSVAEVVELRHSEIDSAPNIGNEESARYIQGVASRDEDLLIVVDLNKLLTEEEWSEMSMF